MKKTLLRITARTLLVSMVYQLVFPLYTYALTTGPSQPEVQSFEPVGTTEMVDMFTGDFNYNIPLMDVEGYPINISYHSGVGIEQEASWVGLGWNINPGSINRAVRGLPDDFCGDTVDKELSIQDEKNFKVGTGISIGFELGGFDTKLSLGFKNYVQFNNYKGTSIGISTDASISLPIFNAGVSMGVGSQAGADIDLNAGFRIPNSVSQNIGAGGSGAGSSGFNSRTGIKDVAFGVNGQIMQIPLSYSGTIPIGLQNYVPVVTNPSSLTSFEFQARIGGELYYTFPNGYMSIQKSTMKFEKDGARPGYGYLYAEEAPPVAIMDFSRDKDGRYNKTMDHLPLSSMTYDVYAVTGQGTGGVFRPFRNDIGSVFDPEVKSPQSNMTSVLTEAGIGNLVALGTDISLVDNEVNSGPWKRLSFRGNEKNSLYEKAYFKQGGELTYNNQQLGGVFGDAPVYLTDDIFNLKGKNGIAGSLPAKFGNAHVYNTGSNMDRTTRANLITYLTSEDASLEDVAQDKKIRHYNKFGQTAGDTAFYIPGSAIENNRYKADNGDKAQGKHISEFTQTLPDGRRYVYGIPAMNNLSREVTFSVDNSQADLETGLVGMSGSDDSKDNNWPKEKFYSSTTTPAYAHSYLLSSVLATDYVDVLGDGPTDDDMGGWVKMNYTLWDNDYRWRTPYESNKAQYNPGFWSDKQDDKGSYMIGSRQQWHVRSIESKNYVAEFYVSKRKDGLGATGKVYNGDRYRFDNGNLKNALTDTGFSYRLDSIKLYNKHDRNINGSNATPIKTVMFEYDYSLCKNVPNASGTNTGKLTLKRIYFRYGKSAKNLLSPYEFNYNGPNPDYKFADKDRWGNYKDHTKDGKLSNYEFPYTAQDGSNLDADMAPWNLTQILLPSGGKINVVYESDDYAYIQDKRTMQMFHIEGVGNSTKKDNQTKLYEDLNTVNDYLYFKRIPAKEDRSLSMRDNYLEGTDYLYYSFALDISGSGKYEHIKGYAHIESLDKCSDDTSYCYIKIVKEHPGNHSSLLHPATIYGINNGRYYLPHIIYPGYLTGDEGGVKIGKALLDAIGEFDFRQNPIVRLVEKKHLGRDIDIDKSFIRLHRPGLTKKGGGIRVKQLTLSDSWKALTASSTNVDADYGKNYSYTTVDPKYGLISSGVASYEPTYGGDENPFRMPVPYTVEAGRLLPKIDFFQEAPFGESFFPPPVVGYSDIKVSSIHIAEGRSSQSYEDYEFYTAKDFPIEIDYTKIDGPEEVINRGYNKKSKEIKVMQGYVLRFNDMHGKPKSITNSILKSDGGVIKPEPVSRVAYNYRQQDGKLYNKVLALKRNRGTLNTYSIDSTTLGVETDFTVDSRERYNRTFKRNISINLNIAMIGVFPVPLPSAFFPEKEESETFHSMVTTKIVQRYGILESVEKMDHGVVARTENVIFDSETGGVLLSKTNNEYNNDIYSLKYPAYWAYEKMGPAYMHVGFEEKSDSLIIDPGSLYGKLHLSSGNFFPGDEVLLTYTHDDGGIKTTYQAKGWIMEDYRVVASGMVPAPYRITSLLPRQTVPSNVKWVALRALQNSSGASMWPGPLNGGDFGTDVTVRILRSARRNMLDKNVQQTTLAQNPYTSSINDLLGGTTGSSAFNKVLNVGVQEFTDWAVPYGSIATDTTTWDAAPAGYYHPHMLPVDVDSANKQVLNRYVLGHRGNFRPFREYIYIDNRVYNNDAKTDGVYAIKSHPFWGNINGSANSYAILNTTGAEAPYWKKTHQVTKYDVFGNVLEELDATANRTYPLTGNSQNYGMQPNIGKRTAVQYGYNKSLPTAIASNVQQRSFFYEGFEEYSMLVPKNLYFLYKNSYYHKTPLAQNYQTLDMSGSKVKNNRYGQDYRQYAMTTNGDSVTSATAHSGNYSIRFNAARTFNIGSQTRHSEVTSLFNLLVNAERFRLDRNRKYLVSVWFKPVSGGATGVLSSIGFSYVNATTTTPTTIYPFALKTGNVDGWYKAEYMTPADMTYMYLTLPSGAYFDDIRMIPLDASMKSYVYDPVSFKLTAQLDENNFTTFYEYDQEGLLVRVKKETDRGIQTVSESRRSNSKKKR